MTSETTVVTTSGTAPGLSEGAFAAVIRRTFVRFGSKRLGLIGLTFSFIVSRICLSLAGVRLRQDFTTVHFYWQTLDTSALRWHFLQSILYLHIQPPLYNIDLGLLGFLPAGWVPTATNITDLAMGIVFVLATFLLICELPVPVSMAFVVALLVEINPATILYENWQFYTYPTAMLMSVAALSCAKFWKSCRFGWGLALFSSCAAIVLLNSTFQLPWMIGMLAPIVVFSRRHWKLVLVVGSLPVLLVLGWYVKNAVIFGTYTTSSLFGMNLARTTLETAAPGKVASLVAAGVLTPIADEPLWQPAGAYMSLKGKRRATGIRALDENMKVFNEGPNLNNKNEIAISDHYLHDDIAFIKADPPAYLRSIAGAVRIWFEPSDQYYWVEGNLSVISPYARVFDKVIGLQPATTTETSSPMAQVSYGAVFIYLLALFGAPVLFWRRRRDRAYAGTLLFMWTSVAYTFVLTSLIEYGENNRFRFELGALPLILALVVVVELGRAVRARGRAADPHPQDRAIADLHRPIT